MKIPELVAPAGSLEKLEIAYLYGADAAYCGLKDYNLRNRAENFTFKELKKAVLLSNKMKKKLYLTLNAYFYENDIKKLDSFLKRIEDTGCDTLIVSDPGVFLYIRERFKNFKIHISTQANTTNSYAVKFWYNHGASRIILARELTLNEIKTIHKLLPDVELEVFVHGAVCLSYSGRCFLSLYLTGRNANQGDCAHPCRFEYALCENKRKEDLFPVFDIKRGTVVLSSKDLNLIRYIPSLIKSGVSAFKIEGRMKSLYYVAAVTAAYRKAIDAAVKKEKLPLFAVRELDSVSHRPFFKGFIFGRKEVASVTKKSYVRKYSFIGWIKKKISDGFYEIDIKNPLQSGLTYEIFRYDNPSSFLLLKDFTLFHLNGKKIESVPLLKIQDRGFIKTTLELKRGYIIRKKISLT